MFENMSIKEKTIAAIVAVVLAYALAVGLWFMRQEGEWRSSSKTYERAVKRYREEAQLIAEKNKWADAYEEEKARMPLFEADKHTDTTWFRRMDSLADKFHIAIGQKQGGKEITAGEVLEFPIEVKSWEGSLEALVRFIHELENTDEGMFDIRSISFKPSSKKGYLKGAFTLTCAYMREK